MGEGFRHPQIGQVSGAGHLNEFVGHLGPSNAQHIIFNVACPGDDGDKGC